MTEHGIQFMVLTERKYFKLYINLRDFYDKATPIKIIHFKKRLK